nr:MAG TPA: hypothetical protein [Caudoviricetes sp.]
MSYDFRNYLKAAGLGESAPVRRRKVNVKPKAFNAMAFAESYKFIAEDGKRMALSNNRLNNELRRTAAKGEAGAEEFKQKLKDGMAKVKKVLIELYDKIIRFFTETVRYWMSNERKVAKTIVNLKNAKKNSSKKDSFTVPFILLGKGAQSLDSRGVNRQKNAVRNGSGNFNLGESYLGFGEEDGVENPDDRAEKEVQEVEKNAVETKEEVKSGKNEVAKVTTQVERATLGSITEIEAAEKAFETALKGSTDVIRKYSARGMIIALPIASKALTDIGIALNAKLTIASSANVNVKDLTFDDAKRGIDQIVGFVRAGFKEVLDAVKPNYEKTVKVGRNSFGVLCDIMIMILEELKGDGKTIRSINAEIRKLTEAKRKLQDSFKENKNPSEEETLRYQVARASLGAQTTVLNLYMGYNDKLIGIGVQLSGKLISAV